MKLAVCLFSLACLVLFLANPASCELTILNLGDSQSINDIHRQRFSEFLVSEGIAHRFVGDVQSAYPHQAYAGAKFTHMVNGRFVDRDRDGVQEWEAGLADALVRYEPDLILFFGGFNDITQGAVHWVKENYDSVINYATENNPNPLASIIVSNLTDLDPSHPKANWRDELVEFNRLITEDAAQRRQAGQSITVVDNYSQVPHSMLQVDGLHLEDAAYETIGQSWSVGFLATNLQPVPEPSSPLLLLLVGSLAGARRWWKSRL